MNDFTLKQYLNLCRTLIREEYLFVTISDYLMRRPKDGLSGKFVIIRHDVDRWIYNSLTMAEIEKELGIHSTYYFRYPVTFNSNIIYKIHSLGHEVGYHYEVLCKSRGDIHKAWVVFMEELNRFREIVPVDTVSMHGSPLSSFDSRDIWRYHSLKEVGLIGEAYALGEDVIYFTDTGRSWSSRYNLRDYIPENEIGIQNIYSTDELIVYIKKEKPTPLYLNIHPERWNDSFIRYTFSYLMDVFFSVGKLIIKNIRYGFCAIFTKNHL